MVASLLLLQPLLPLPLVARNRKTVESLSGEVSNIDLFILSLRHTSYAPPQLSDTSMASIAGQKPPQMEDHVEHGKHRTKMHASADPRQLRDQYRPDA